MNNLIIKYIVESLVGLGLWFGGIFVVSIFLLVLVGMVFS